MSNLYKLIDEAERAKARETGPVYPTKSSGQTETFPTGAHRDAKRNKGRFDLIPYEPLLRLARLYERGAELYGARNWQKGIPLSSYLSSAARHLAQLTAGWDDEDHAAAVLFNVMGYMWTREGIEMGELPASLADDALGVRLPREVVPGLAKEVTK
jgi:hypothetical protein